MELLQLQYFAEVARLESYTKAAQTLHVSQPALSQTVRRLEKEVGVRLFEREGRRVRLTETGRNFYTRISQSLAELQSAYDSLTCSRIQGNVLIGTYMPIYPIVDCIRAFADENPDITFFFHYMSNPPITARRFDALLFYGQSDSLGFNESFPIGETLGVFAVPESFDTGGQSAVRLSELAHTPFVSLAREDGWVEEIFRDFSHAGYAPNIRFRTNASLIKQEIIEAGLAVGSSNAMLTRHFLDTGKYRTVLRRDGQNTGGRKTRIRLSMGWRDTDYLAPAARALKQFSARWFSDPAHQMKGDAV